MSSIVFVHGTGVRDTAFRVTFEKIVRQLASHLPDLDVQPCYWGGAFGAHLNAAGASIPQYDSTRGVAHSMPAGDMEALWEMLERYPLMELRMLSLRAPSGAELAPMQTAPGVALASAFARLLPLSQFGDTRPALPEAIHADGMLDRLEAAIHFVGASQVFRDCMRTASGDMDDYRRATARAVTAVALYGAEGMDVAPADTMSDDAMPDTAMADDPALRDALTTDLARALGEPVTAVEAKRGFGSWILGQIGGVVAGIGTNFARRRRGAITDATAPASGDIVLYQARGEHIRNCIREAVRSAPGPVTLLAHSLGGIACVDLLASEDLGVRHLVTVGSQAPYLYEINALASLPFDASTAPELRLPKYFPPWTNIYDPRDFLSFIGAGLFGTRVTDIEVDNRQAFPRSHSAYWDNDAVWRSVAGRLA